MQTFEHRIEEIIISIVILLGIFDFFDILPDYLGYTKKIVSWIVLGYLLYKLSLTTIFFNEKRVHIDLMIIVAYFLLVIKNLIGYMQSAIEEVVVLKDFYSFMLNNAFRIEYYALHIGWLLLFLLSFYLAYKLRIGKPSLMEVFHAQGYAADLRDFIFRTVTIFIVLVGFFIIVFNFMFEWLAFAIDAPLLMIGILFYLFIIIRHHKKFNPEHIINKLGTIGEDFYKEFISLFHYKERIALGVIGMLVLHMLTDVGNFIIPYVTGFKGMYLGQLGLGHTPLIYLLKEDITLVNGLAKLALLLVYLFNIFAILFFLLMPAFVWYRLFKNREIHVSSVSLSVIIPSLISFLLMPSFGIKTITEKGLVGVDILTKSILSKNIISLFITNVDIAVIFTAVSSLILGVIVFLLELDKKIRKRIFMLTVSIGMFFFIFYIFYFMISIIGYYTSTISFLFTSSYYVMLVYFIIFLIINILFYSVGTALFIYEIIKNHVFYRSYMEMD